MQVYFGQAHNKLFPEGCALTIGNFDGVHSGHLQILKKLKLEANTRQLAAVAIVFEPQPQEYFAKKQGSKVPFRLSPLRDKINLLKQTQCLDALIVYRFNPSFAKQTARDFIQHELISHFNIKYLLIGDDFRFGAGRKGDVHLLKQQPEFITEQMNSIMIANNRASSTAVRNALQAGDIELANQILGHDYSLSGTVKHGKKLGRTLGVPTANIHLPNHIYPLSGVYIVVIEGPFGIKKGVSSFGVNPTVSHDYHQKLEVHIFDLNEVLYGKKLKISFKHKIRDELLFPNIETLQQQILTDIQIAKTWEKP